MIFNTIFSGVNGVKEVKGVKDKCPEDKVWD